MPVTIREIAERSGLSVPTVSQILNNKGHRYRSETCKRVMKAVRELGYRPNSFARAIRMGRFNCVALLLSTEKSKSFLPNELLRGVHDGVAERDYHMSLTALPDEKLTSQGFVPKILTQWSADGLLIKLSHPRAAAHDRADPGARHSERLDQHAAEGRLRLPG
ncbi:MAG TPA: LacI family DNA-binding transcriptional regulator [Planctomycetota bacterium]|nr:LacI family DNA-binding transcriptional regulator [Planctomycetota bacterium]